jgi:lipopolysaccharide/colanic/teichoic acid biosynthesis glycosyltransferase
MPVVTLPEMRLGRSSRLLKRAFDLTLSAVALLLLAPLLGLVALAIRLDSRGPAIYRQPRRGRNGSTFSIAKFRTMQIGAEQRRSEVFDLNEVDGPLFKIKQGDPRVTRVGTFLRKTSLDELPQLWNVLRGDMSLVGPRPIRPIFFERLAADLPAYWQRLVVRPGLTGFAQVRREYETSMAEKLAHDLEWIADRSLRLYVRTLAVTAWRLARQALRSGRRSSSSR